MIWIMLIFFPQTSTILIRKLCCMCLRTTKQWSIWFSREEARQWDMFPEPTELLLIGYSIESIWTPKSKSNTLTPKTNSQTYWPREISHVMNGIIFCVCLTLAISVHQLFWGDVDRNAKRFRWRKSHWKIEANDELSLAMQRKDSWRACLYCMRKPGENQTWKSTTSELMEWAASMNRETCFWRELIKLLRVECWQELVFPRVEIWWIDGCKNRETCLWTTTRDDDMDSDTVAETDMSLISRSFLHRVNESSAEWSSAKDSGPILKRCNTRQQQTFFNMENVYFFDLEASVFMGKNSLENFHSIKKYRKRFHNETDVRHIWKVDSRTIRWDLWSEYN